MTRAPPALISGIGVTRAPPVLISRGLAFHIAIDNFSSIDHQSFQYRASLVLMSTIAWINEGWTILSVRYAPVELNVNAYWSAAFGPLMSTIASDP